MKNMALQLPTRVSQSLHARLKRSVFKTLRAAPCHGHNQLLCIILNWVPCNLIRQRAAKRRAVFSLVSPEACCDVTEASTECNGAVARPRRSMT